MAYTLGDTILDDHYNDFATSVNAVWGTGSSDSGYGMGTTVSSVSAGTTITATQWTTLLARISSAASHQGSSITAIANPSAGTTISAFTALSGNISTITTNRLNVFSRQAAVNANVDNTSTFTGTITQTETFTFGSANAARYFFNAGGRLSVSWSLTGGTADSKYSNWSALATACGTYYINAQTSGKSGGSGSPTTNSTNSGFYDLTGTPTAVFKQFEDTSPYTASYIQLNASTTSTVVTLTSLWVDAAADQTSYNKSIYNVQDQVDGTKRTTFGYEKHTTTYVSDNTSTITVANTVNSHA